LLRPGLQHLAHAFRIGWALQTVQGDLLGLRKVFPVQPSGTRQRLHDGAGCHQHIAVRSLRGFNVDVQRPILTLGVDEVHQVDQQAGLAGLARGVQDEILACSDQP